MKLLEKILSLLFVPRCVGCGSPLPIGKGPLCADCYPLYLREKEEECPTCGLLPKDCLCAQRPLSSHGIGEVHKLFFYHATAHERVTNRALYRLKHKGDPLVLDFFAEEMAKMLAPLLIGDKEKYLLTFAPRSRRAIRQDGFDHMALLGERLSRLLSVPFLSTLDRRGGKEQKRLSRKERFLNMKDVYTPREGLLLRGRCVIVIDDITTSGATLLSVVSALRRAGARGVKVAVLGATPLLSRYKMKKRR